MSRTPVHEALIRLQSEGLVKVLPKRGVLVCAISPEDMREIYDVIIACESTAAELLAALPESERQAKAAALEALNTSMGIALRQNDRLAWARADDAFHRLLMASCGNSRLARIAEMILDQSHRKATPDAIGPLAEELLSFASNPARTEWWRRIFFAWGRRTDPLRDKRHGEDFCRPRESA